MTDPERAGSVLESESERRQAAFEAAFLTYYDRIAGLLSRLLGDSARA